jgi:hypothetical protein
MSSRVRPAAAYLAPQRELERSFRVLSRLGLGLCEWVHPRFVLVLGLLRTRSPIEIAHPLGVAAKRVDDDENASANRVFGASIRVRRRGGA